MVSTNTHLEYFGDNSLIWNMLKLSNEVLLEGHLVYSNKLTI